jgi:hypothetical protein
MDHATGLHLLGARSTALMAADSALPFRGGMSLLRPTLCSILRDRSRRTAVPLGITHCRVLQEVDTISVPFRQAVSLPGGFAASLSGAVNCATSRLQCAADKRPELGRTTPSPFGFSFFSLPSEPYAPPYLYLTLYSTCSALPSSLPCSLGPLPLWPSRRRRSRRTTASVTSRRRASARRSLRDRPSSTASRTGRTLSVRHLSPDNDRRS